MQYQIILLKVVFSQNIKPTMHSFFYFLRKLLYA